MAIKFKGDTSVAIINSIKKAEVDTVYRCFDSGVLLSNEVINHGDFVSWDGTKWIKRPDLSYLIDNAEHPIEQQIEDIADVIPEGTTEENPLVNETDLGEVAERVTTAEGDIDSIEEKIPSGASSSNKLVTESDLEAAQDSWQSGFTPKGEATVSQIDALTTQSNGDQYIVTDSGTITAGSVAVVAGDTVAWDSENEVWYKVTQYAKASEQAALTTYAQNVAHSIAPEYNGTLGAVAGKLYMHGGVLYRCKTSHSGAWGTGSDFEATSVETIKQTVAHLLGDTATEADLVAGNYIAIDGSATKKLPADKVASAYDALKNFSSSSSYKRGERVNYNGHPFEARDDLAAGAFDIANWKLIDNFIDKSLVGMGVVVSGQYGNDLNNFPANTILTCSNATIGGNISHKPNDETTFLVATFGSDFLFGNRFQIVNTATKKIFIRGQYGTNVTGWGPWTEIKNESDINGHSLLKEFDTTKSYYRGSRVLYNNYPFEAKDDLAAGAFDIANWKPISNFLEKALVGMGAISSGQFGDDLNLFPANSMYTCIDETIGGNILHKPNDETTFSVVTLGSGFDYGTKIQIVNTKTKKIFIRGQFGTNVTGWGAWNEIKNESEAIPYDNVLAAFNNIVCIGDSLTDSQVWTGPSTTRQAYKTWPQIVGKICDADVEVFARSGDTTIANWTRYNSQVTSKINALAIIYLGTNYGLTDTLDTDAPVADDPSIWADTNTGCYAKWVAKLQSLGYKVLLVKCWVTGGEGGASLEDTNKVIGQVGTRFGCAVLDKIQNNDYKYHYWPSREDINAVHYNDLGYAWFASEIIKRASNLDTNEMKYIIPA